MNKSTHTNPKVDTYLIQGCMRCPYGATERCKVIPWRAILEELRQLLLESGLEEEVKWGVPCYTRNGKNVVIVAALKAYATLSFFKGSLLEDKSQVLEKEGSSSQAGRSWRFTKVEEVQKHKELIMDYIDEAIAIEDSGKKVVLEKVPEPIPEELLDAFAEDQALEHAFFRLTPGRQRGYIIHFSQPKQSQTRKSRITKLAEQIKLGIGLHDKYKKQ
jgi:uncharacterized protein YdeI (YjbR/CyaY-like superfamily)